MSLREFCWLLHAVLRQPLCFPGETLLEAMDAVPLAEALLSICDTKQCHTEGIRLLGHRRRLFKSLLLLGIYAAALGVMRSMTQLDSMKPPAPLPAKSRAPGRKKIQMPAEDIQPFDHLEFALKHAETVLGSSGSSISQIHACYKALNALRRAIKKPEDLLAKLESSDIHGSVTALLLSAKAADLLVQAVWAGASKELTAGVAHLELGAPHAWSCAAAAFVQAAKLRAAAANAGLLAKGEALCSTLASGQLLNGTSDAGSHLKPDELKWIAASMHN
eukprot:scaffold97209_cov44-Prasinocladus_malaysianus.AAC.1